MFLLLMIPNFLMNMGVGLHKYSPLMGTFPITTLDPPQKTTMMPIGL